MLLSPDDVDGEVEPLDVAQALARRSAFAVSLTAEVDTDAASDSCCAHAGPCSSRGSAPSLSGLYLVQRVRHVVAARAAPTAA